MNTNALNESTGKRHAYYVEVEWPDLWAPTGYMVDEVEVYANNRDEAAAIAEQAGYRVRSVNMVG